MRVTITLQKYQDVYDYDVTRDVMMIMMSHVKLWWLWWYTWYYDDYDDGNINHTGIKMTEKNCLLVHVYEISCHISKKSMKQVPYKK